MASARDGETNSLSYLGQKISQGRLKPVAQTDAPILQTNSRSPLQSVLVSGLVPTAEERQRGFVLFARDPFIPVSSEAVPLSAERIAELGSFATPGQYQPLALGVHALEDLAGLKVELSALRSAEGKVIEPDQIDLRVGREIPVPVDLAARMYRVEPFLLEKQNSFSLEKSRSLVLWLTLHVPQIALPGEYSGLLSIHRPAHSATTVRLRLQVLPFSLPPPPIETTMYYPRPAEADQMLYRELIDLREHGASVPIPAMEVRVQSRDQQFGPDDAAETVAWAQRLLGACRKVFGPWRFPVTFEAGHQIAYYWDPSRNWFAYWKHSPEIERDFGQAIELIRAVAKSNGTPALRIYVSDEGGAHNLLDEAAYYNRWVKRHFSDVATTASIGGGIALGFDEIGQLSEVVDLLAVNRFTPEIVRVLLARNQPYAVYNGAGDTAAGARFFFGFYGHKTGAQQIGQWSYSFGESPFTGNGLRQPDEGYVYHAPDGPLPTIRWEAVREGIDDLRYTTLLRQLIAAGLASDLSAQRSAAQNAEKVLNGILAKIGWGFQALQSSERTPPPHPAALRKWRWQVARQILALRKAGITAGAVAPPTQPCPLELPWAQSEAKRDAFGSELLPTTDFQPGLKPWRVEAWTGQGRGALDPAEPHRGSPSVRIDSPPADGNRAVTVLVWPQYGDNKINLTLDANRPYEFSAWVKLRDRALPPELRINVPSDALQAARSGHDPPDRDGWQRLWTRAELKSAAKPNYLAIWLQGTGTVWLSHLSLREVIPSALTLSLDQDEFDGLDHVAIAAVEVGNRVTARLMRCSVCDGTGETLADSTVPMKPISPPETVRHQFIFYPSGFTPGPYRLQVELRDEAGAAFARETVTFQRLTD